MSTSESSGGLAPLGGGLKPIGGTGVPANPSGSSLRPPKPAAALTPPPPLRNPVPTGVPTATASPAAAVRPVFAYATDDVNDGNETHRHIVRFLVSGSVAAVAIVLFFMFRIPPPVPAPTDYTTFTSGDNAFTCDAPHGWNQSASGAASGDPNSVGLNGVFFTSGNAKIEVTMSSIAALVGAQLMFGKELTPEAMTGSRANGAHKVAKTAASRWLKGYVEHDVKDEVPNGMGGLVAKDITEMNMPTMKGNLDALLKDAYKNDARLSEYTATGNYWGLGGKVHGYRATLAGSKLIASVICQCSERDWPRLKPVFLHVMGTVHETQKPGDNKDRLAVPGAGTVRLPGT